jgi:two-component system, OmpR family, response regulator ChvI
MMNSTKIASNLAGVELDKFYPIFLTAKAILVRNFGGKIIKNAGDALINYFPDRSDSSDMSAFKDVLECGITMIAAHRAVNSRMQAERLSSLNYRISADYGMWRSLSRSHPKTRFVWIGNESVCQNKFESTC